MTKQPMKSIILTGYGVEFLLTALEVTPTKDRAAMESMVKLITPMKEIHNDCYNQRVALFKELATKELKPGRGKGGGKLKEDDYEMQVVGENKKVYNEREGQIGEQGFEIAMFETELKFLKAYMGETIYSVGNHKDNEGMMGLSYMTNYLHVMEAIDNAKPYVPEERNEDASKNEDQPAPEKGEDTEE